MTDFTPTTDMPFDYKDPLTVEKMEGIRDNPLAMFEGATGAPRLQTGGIEDSAVTTDKIADDNVTVSKLNVGSRSYSGSLASSATVSYVLDAYSFTPIVTGNNIVADLRNGSIFLTNTDPSATQDYTVDWNYLIS